MDGMPPCMMYLVSLTAVSAQRVDPFLKVAHAPHDFFERRVLPEEHRGHRPVVSLQLPNSKLRRNQSEGSQLRLTQTRLGRAVELLLELHYAGKQHGIVKSLLEDGGVSEPI